MITVNVNLIAFSSNKSVGTLIYTKRLFRQIFKMNYGAIRFVFYAQERFDFSDFRLPDNTEVVRVPQIKNPIIRRVYEHTIFHFKLKKADYIFTPYLTLPLLFTRAKQIVTIHDMVPFIILSKYNKITQKLLKFETLAASKLATKIVTVSNNSKNDICRITGKIPCNVHVAYNFISSDETVVQCNRNPNIVEFFGITKPYFLTVATLQPGKNIERLIRSFGYFVKENPDFQLCIVGNKGWGFAPIYEEVDKLKLHENIIFTGYIEEDILDVLYSHCYGVVYVSLYEGFGIPPLEGFYHNKAAVVSNNSSLPEVVGQAAILVDPTDELSISCGLQKFTKIKDELVKNIKEQKDKFIPEKIVRNFLKIF